jgi:hypothetical protein
MRKNSEIDESNASNSGEIDRELANLVTDDVAAAALSAFLSTERPLNTVLNSFVLGASNARISNTKIFSSNTLEDSADLIAKRRTFLGNL